MFGAVTAMRNVHTRGDCARAHAHTNTNTLISSTHSDVTVMSQLCHRGVLPCVVLQRQACVRGCGLLLCRSRMC